MALIEIDERVSDIGRRIVEGDELWRGDPNMALVFNPQSRQYEVLALDDHGNFYIAASSPQCGPHLLVELSVSDWQHGKERYEQIMAANRKAKAAVETTKREAAAEQFDKLHFAMVKEFGHLEGGTRRLFGQVGKGLN